MSIQFDQEAQRFHLYNERISYVMQVGEGGYLTHLYFGKHIDDENLDYLADLPSPPHAPVLSESRAGISYCGIPLEYSAFGGKDLRYPAFMIENESGSHICEPTYVAHRIYRGKDPLPGMPYARPDDTTETLEIVLEDRVAGVQIVLRYSLFAQYDAITRSVNFRNISNRPIRLTKAASMQLDLGRSNLDIIFTEGQWAREHHIVRQSVTESRVVLDTLSGRSGYHHDAFFVLCDRNADEYTGEAYGFNLLYSGNFEASVEADYLGDTRAVFGISPMRFSFALEQEFATPECVMVYANNGLTSMSQKFHKLYNGCIVNPAFHHPRPVLINNWEATYFRFDEEKLLALAKKAKEVGTELFVLDDGWFGKRNSDNCSLGDWFPNEEKLPSGIDGLAKKIRALGLQFGLWIEPEMISFDSDLYRTHPDWLMCEPNHDPSPSRNQYVLDLSRREVRDYIKSVFDSLLRSGNISYMKWDMNRYLSEVFSPSLNADRQGELYHRYVLGLYELMQYLCDAYPNVLFEACSGGGGRYDGGMLFYFPQIWTSDDTDAAERLPIHRGITIVYPVSSVSAHYSIVPNHQVGRVTTSDMRAFVNYQGAFGLELDLLRLDEREIEKIRRYIEIYKAERALIVDGDLYRLQNDDGDNIYAWMTVNDDRSEAVLTMAQILRRPNAPRILIRLKGLREHTRYHIQNVMNGEEKELYGSTLMYAGLALPGMGDFSAVHYHLQAME